MRVFHRGEGEGEVWSESKMSRWTDTLLFALMTTTTKIIRVFISLLMCVCVYIYIYKGLMPKLKLQFFGQLMQRTDSLEKTLMLGKNEGRTGEGDDRKWDGWMASSTWWTQLWASSGSWWWTGKPGMLQSIGSQSWTQLSNRTELNWAQN